MTMIPIIDSLTATLQLRFKDDEGKLHTFSFPKAAQDLPSDTVGEAMKTIAELNLFTRNGTQLYRKPVSGAYVNIKTNTIYSA
ncbi:hypothetical protein FD04_GL000427 [Secundilactobacillus odoratitofui DSM 19909 = JCM 15043]|uniref:DUF2922 domain-containing protein n=2 Tax=Secundilactobacillus odoratitofui TaxID=480930 RepID=A0A0R1LYI2_9LACO|nr:hypothetical protein FD04_GL000427 [Secundilactobacillus odoratitofui DSM 19909 = JCM 15043]